MGTRDPRIDAYIAKQRPFAQPILEHIRDVVHAACPDVEETLKWSSPFFMYRGEMLCHMGAFKEHAAMGFWKAALIEGLGDKRANGESSAGDLGRLTSVKDLPGKRELTGYIKQAMKLKETGKTANRPRVAKPEAEVPPALAAALKKNRAAKAAFDAFAPSHRRDYCEWIASAKRDETRDKRVAQAMEWIAEGKARNWKYGA